MRVGELAHRTGTTIRALRYYDAAGLVVPRRLGNGYREYDPAAVRLVEQIRTLTALGFSVEETRPFVEAMSDGDGGHPAALSTYRRAVAGLELRIERLTGQRDALLTLVEAAAGPAVPRATARGRPGHASWGPHVRLRAATVRPVRLNVVRFRDAARSWWRSWMDGGRHFAHAALAGLLTDPDPAVRKSAPAALDGLLDHGPPDTYPTRSERWRDTPWHFERRGCYPAWLAERLVNHPALGARFAQVALADTSPQLREAGAAAATAILMQWRTPPDGLWAAVASGLTDTDPRNRANATMILSGAGPAAAPFADALAPLLLERVLVSSDYALAALGRLGDARAVPALLRHLSGSHWWGPYLRACDVMAPLAAHAPVLMPAMRRWLHAGDRTVEEYLPVLVAWGPAGVEAVPDLLALLDSGYAAAACSALGSIGPGALPAAGRLADLARGRPAPLTGCGGSATPYGWHGTQVAAWAHWRITGDPALVLEVVGAAARRRGSGHAVLRYLGELGPAASAYADNLRVLLDLPGAWSQVEAAYAWWRVTGDPAPAVPVLIEALRPLGHGRSGPLVRCAVRYLGAIGPAAAAASPLLERVLADERRYPDANATWAYDNRRIEEVGLGVIRDDDELVALARRTVASIRAT